MCYPSEHANGQFIPNWSMWYVLELKEYLSRTDDRDFIDALKDNIYRLLDYFKNKKELIFELRSGFALTIDDVYLSAELNGRNVRVAKFSKAFTEKLEKLQEKGYHVTRGEVQFIVAWKGEDDEKETPIILSNLYFTKK